VVADRRREDVVDPRLVDEPVAEAGDDLVVGQRVVAAVLAPRPEAVRGP
jgi:hypothetical protein